MKILFALIFTFYSFSSFSQEKLVCPELEDTNLNGTYNYQGSAPKLNQKLGKDKFQFTIKVTIPQICHNHPDKIGNKKDSFICNLAQKIQSEENGCFWRLPYSEEYFMFFKPLEEREKTILYTYGDEDFFIFDSNEFFKKEDSPSNSSLGVEIKK
ncbi:MAG: hypothetical protein KBD63_00015 [Bacteriovoracaceae bacterium]|nr:hypothetical protein [Bacteriovoracaceae bacterium]